MSIFSKKKTTESLIKELEEDKQKLEYLLVHVNLLRNSHKIAFNKAHIKEHRFQIMNQLRGLVHEMSEELEKINKNLPKKINFDNIKEHEEEISKFNEKYSKLINDIKTENEYHKKILQEIKKEEPFEDKEKNLQTNLEKELKVDDKIIEDLQEFLSQTNILIKESKKKYLDYKKEKTKRKLHLKEMIDNLNRILEIIKSTNIQELKIINILENETKELGVYDNQKVSRFSYNHRTNKLNNIKKNLLIIQTHFNRKRKFIKQKYEEINVFNFEIEIMKKIYSNENIDNSNFDYETKSFISDNQEKIKLLYEKIRNLSIKINEEEKLINLIINELKKTPSTTNTSTENLLNYIIQLKNNISSILSNKEIESSIIINEELSKIKWLENNGIKINESKEFNEFLINNFEDCIKLKEGIKKEKPLSDLNIIKRIIIEKKWIWPKIIDFLIQTSELKIDIDNLNIINEMINENSWEEVVKTIIDIGEYKIKFNDKDEFDFIKKLCLKKPTTLPYLIKIVNNYHRKCSIEEIKKLENILLSNRWEDVIELDDKILKKNNRNVGPGIWNYLYNNKKILLNNFNLFNDYIDLAKKDISFLEIFEKINNLVINKPWIWSKIVKEIRNNNMPNYNYIIGLNSIENIITKKNFENMIFDLKKLSTRFNHERNFFEKGLPSFKNIITNKIWTLIVEGFVEMNLSEDEIKDLINKDFFSSFLPHFENVITEKNFKEIIKYFLIINKNLKKVKFDLKLYLMIYHIKHIITKDNWEDILKKIISILEKNNKNYENIFEHGFPAVKDIITEKNWNIIIDGLIKITDETKENSKYIFISLPEIKNILNNKNIDDIINELIIISKEIKENSKVIKNYIETLKETINEENWPLIFSYLIKLNKEFKENIKEAKVNDYILSILSIKKIFTKNNWEEIFLKIIEIIKNNKDQSKYFFRCLRLNCNKKITKNNWNLFFDGLTKIIKYTKNEYTEYVITGLSSLDSLFLKKNLNIKNIWYDLIDGLIKIVIETKEDSEKLFNELNTISEKITKENWKYIVMLTIEIKKYIKYNYKGNKGNYFVTDFFLELKEKKYFQLFEDYFKLNKNYDLKITANEFICFKNILLFLNFKNKSDLEIIQNLKRIYNYNDKEYLIGFNNEINEKIKKLEKEKIIKNDDDKKIYLKLNLNFLNINILKNELYLKKIAELSYRFILKNKGLNNLNDKEFYNYVKNINNIGNLDIGDFVSIKGEKENYLYKITNFDSEGYYIVNLKNILYENENKKGPISYKNLVKEEYKEEWNNIYRLYHENNILILHSTHAYGGGGSEIEGFDYDSFKCMENNLGENKNFTISCFSISPRYRTSLYERNGVSYGNVLNKGKIYHAYIGDWFTIPKFHNNKRINQFRYTKRKFPVPIKFAITGEYSNDYNELLPINWSSNALYYSEKTPNEIKNKIHEIARRNKVNVFIINSETNEWVIKKYNELEDI